ncbi:MAG TPA: hypothetical protein VFA74_16150, partial [Terriglobales bacterium]|nr:hypothetical protein [Terriglobales bacterium]
CRPSFLSCSLSAPVLLNRNPLVRVLQDKLVVITLTWAAAACPSAARAQARTPRLRSLSPRVPPLALRRQPDHLATAPRPRFTSV